MGEAFRIDARHQADLFRRREGFQVLFGKGEPWYPKGNPPFIEIQPNFVLRLSNIKIDASPFWVGTLHIWHGRRVRRKGFPKVLRTSNPGLSY